MFMNSFFIDYFFLRNFKDEFILNGNYENLIKQHQSEVAKFKALPQYKKLEIINNNNNYNNL